MNRLVILIQGFVIVLPRVISLTRRVLGVVGCASRVVDRPFGVTAEGMCLAGDVFGVTGPAVGVRRGSSGSPLE
jgi:hypothetical protein